MKKFLLVAMCVLTLVCLCACKKDMYKKMDEIVSADYAQINISVETTKGNDKLSSQITVKNQENKSTVDYNVEMFTKITSDQIPENYKTTYIGKVEMTDGVVTSETGDKIDLLDFSKAVSIRCRFDKTYFSDAEFVEGVFTAKVLAPRQFMGDSSLNCSEMDVRFEYEAEQKVLTISYVDNKGVSVKIIYAMQ